MSTALVWLRRDIRLEDHAALSAACAENDEVHIIFVFDQNIIKKLKDSEDKRLTFIHHGLLEVHQELVKNSSGLNVVHGDPVDLIPSFAKKIKANKVYFNRDYESYALTRDRKVRKLLSELKISTIEIGRAHV